MQDVLNSIVDYVMNILPDLITSLLIFFASLYLGAVLEKLVHKTLKVRKVSAGAVQMLGGVTRVSVITVGTIIALQSFFDVVTFLSGLGILALTVGFALQDVMKNFASGIILVVQQPFKVDESVNISGFDGTIVKLDLRSTEIKSSDGRVVILPNADILAKPIINYTRALHRRVDVPVGVGYGSDADAARRAVLDAVQNVPGFEANPAPQAGYLSFGDNVMQLNVSFWVNPAHVDPDDAKDAALTLIKKAMHKQGIEFPYPIK